MSETKVNRLSARQMHVLNTWLLEHRATVETEYKPMSVLAAEASDKLGFLVRSTNVKSALDVLGIKRAPEPGAIPANLVEEIRTLRADVDRLLRHTGLNAEPGPGLYAGAGASK